MQNLEHWYKIPLWGNFVFSSMSLKISGMRVTWFRKTGGPGSFFKKKKRKEERKKERNLNSTL